MYLQALKQFLQHYLFVQNKTTGLKKEYMQRQYVAIWICQNMF